MGFLKNILKNKINEGIGKGISDAVGKAVEKVVAPAAEKLAGKAAENINETAEALSQSSEALEENRSELEDALKKLEEVAEEYGIREEMAAEKAAAELAGIRDHGTAAYFEAIIRKDLPSFEIKKNVSLSSFVAGVPEKAAAVDLLLFREGRPAAGILLVPKNSYDTVPIVNTMNYLEANGVKALRFMREFSNEEGYVVSRIMNAL